MSRSLLNVLRTSHFLEFASDEFSQGGEDGILEELFRRLSIEKGSLVDIGAWDGKHLSNSRRLLHRQGWRGLLVEADETRSADCAVMYAEEKGCDVKEELVVVKSALVNFEKGDEASLCSLIESVAFLNYDFELLNIDVDGNDYHLMEHYLDSFAHHQCCKVIVCEFNPSIPNEVYYIQARDMNIQQGSSLRSITQLAVKHGYMLVCTTIFNAIFVRQDLVDKAIPMDYYPPEFYEMLSTARGNADEAKKEVKEVEESALTRVLDMMNKGDMTTSFFQTYDGEIKLVGCKKLLWHDIAINVQKFQVLKKKERRFPFGVDGMEGKRALGMSIRTDLAQLPTLLAKDDDGAHAVDLVRGLLVHVADMLKYACTEDQGLSLIYCLCFKCSSEMCFNKTESLQRVHDLCFPKLIAVVESHADATMMHEADNGDHGAVHGAVFWLSMAEHLASFQESLQVSLLREQDNIILATNGTDITQISITAGAYSAGDRDVSEAPLWVKLARAHRLQGNLLGASFYLRLCFASPQPSEAAYKEVFKLHAKIKALQW